MGEILSVEIVFRSGPVMKVYINEIYDFIIDSVPVEEINFSKMSGRTKKCKSVSLNIRECENRKMWSYEHKGTINYFDWILSAGNISEIKLNLQNYQKRTFSVPWKSDSTENNVYQFCEILSSGDLAIRIEEPKQSD